MRAPSKANKALPVRCMKRSKVIVCPWVGAAPLRPSDYGTVPWSRQPIGTRKCRGVCSSQVSIADRPRATRAEDPLQRRVHPREVGDGRRSTVDGVHPPCRHTPPGSSTTTHKHKHTQLPTPYRGTTGTGSTFWGVYPTPQGCTRAGPRPSTRPPTPRTSQPIRPQGGRTPQKIKFVL